MNLTLKNKFMILAILFVFLLVLGAMIYGSFSWGFVCFKFWYWFILPIFPSLPSLTFYQCVGLFFFIGLFNISNVNSFNYNKTDEQRNNELAGSILAPWLTLVIGWLIGTMFIF